MASVLDLNSVGTKHFHNGLEWIIACHSSCQIAAGVHTEGHGLYLGAVGPDWLPVGRPRFDSRWK